MDNATMERLLLDRSLSALDPVVTALLEAYLQTQPHWSAKARQLDETVGLARRVIGESSPKPLPEFPAGRLAREESKLRFRRGVLKLSAVAASVALGLVIGLTFFGAPQTASEPSAAKPLAVAPSPAMPAAAVAPAITPRALPANPDGVWSASRVLRLAGEQNRPSYNVRFTLWQQPQKGNDL